MGEKLKKIGNIVYWLVVALLLFIVAGTVLSVYEAPGGYRMFVVMSGSMEPSIKVGSVVLVSSKAYEKADVITYLRNPTDNPKDVEATVTHRIMEVSDEEGGVTFRTKGDANEDPDLEAVTKQQVLGRVIIAIPYIGRAIAFAKTQVGFTLLVVVPAVLIIYHEALSIKEGIKKFGRKREDEKDK